MLKISFIIPVFNEVKTVKQAIIQIVELDYQGKEIIIVDNGSLDGSVEIIKEFENLPNVKLFLKKKKHWLWKLYQRGYQYCDRRLSLYSVCRSRI